MIVVGENSYASVDDARQFASDRGVTLPPHDGEVSTMLIRAMDYIEAKRFKGCRSEEDQPLKWPREGVTCCDTVVSSDTVPKPIVDALCHLVMLIHGGLDLMPVVTPSDKVISEKVGSIAVTYSDPAGQSMQPEIPMVDALLNCFLADSGRFRTVRV